MACRDSANPRGGNRKAPRGRRGKSFRTQVRSINGDGAWHAVRQTRASATTADESTKQVNVLTSELHR